MELRRRFLLVFSRVQLTSCSPGPRPSAALTLALGAKSREQDGRGLSLWEAGFHSETQETDSQAKSKGGAASGGWAASPEEVTHQGRAWGGPHRKVLGTAWPTWKLQQDGLGEAGS